jgi:hypothetical protein
VRVEANGEGELLPVAVAELVDGGATGLAIAEADVVLLKNGAARMQRFERGILDRVYDLLIVEARGFLADRIPCNARDRPVRGSAARTSAPGRPGLRTCGT